MQVLQMTLWTTSNNPNFLPIDHNTRLLLIPHAYIPSFIDLESILPSTINYFRPPLDGNQRVPHQKLKFLLKEGSQSFAINSPMEPAKAILLERGKARFSFVRPLANSSRLNAEHERNIYQIFLLLLISTLSVMNQDHGQPRVTNLLDSINLMAYLRKSKWKQRPLCTKTYKQSLSKMYVNQINQVISNFWISAHTASISLISALDLYYIVFYSCTLISNVPVARQGAHWCF